MSHFVDEKQLKKIKLDEEAWVEIPVEFSYEDAMYLQEINVEGKDNLAVANIKLCEKFIRNWNLKLPDGTIAPITEENLKKLKMNTFTKIVTAMVEGFQFTEEDKKKVKTPSE